MSPKQKKLAAKAPPPNKIDEKDFKVLREEKAKGRGMGLQDEKVQPGKVMKAKRGHFSKSNVLGHKRVMGVFPTINKVKPSVGGSGMGKGTDKVSTKKAEDFMKRRKQLGGVGKVISATKIGKMLLPVVGAGVAAQQYLKSKMKKKPEQKPIQQGEKRKKMSGKMGGGMIGPSQRPGYSKGTMVKARGCKLGRTRPTKIT
jgi:hypothetical protein